MSHPKQIDSPLYMLLRKDDVEGFNQEKPRTGTIDMVGGDFRGWTFARWTPPISTSPTLIFALPTFVAWTCAIHRWKVRASLTLRFQGCSSRLSSRLTRF